MKPLLFLPRLVEKLDRLADRVELLLPRPVSPVDWGSTHAALWRQQRFGGHLQAIGETPDTALKDVLGVDRQKEQIEKNTRQFVQGLPANNVLLTGSRGTGKSSLVQALLNEFAGLGLRIVQVDKSDLADLMTIVSALDGEPYRFILFCDDLSFEAQDEGYKAMKSALDGGLYASPDNILIYATSNRRHLIPEYKSDNDGAKVVDTEIHHTEVVEEKVSLSDRFGLWVSFYPINQSMYLAIARHWMQRLGAPHDLAPEWSDELQVLCVRWADNRGTRSGRTAYQFARQWVGQRLLSHSDT
ncbi:ATP-binding protein [Ketobacter sp. MCCC 1A13808]|uniref:ATP-binding protein n=1 Tax=Ketobacter sp. MCCC 1A13808 TaxID=2602738 RepID=UPI0012EB4667|nr:ATP-binding protein [Ketobacter sp. MCCC 1A13808]MVF11022.1 ATP-binding protein [Ketobacter sp. MCCC 1A13808]